MKNSIFKSIVSVVLTISILFSFSALFSVSAISKTGYIVYGLTYKVKVRTTPTTVPGDSNRLKYNNAYVMLPSVYEIVILDENVKSPDDTANPNWCYIEFNYSDSPEKLKGYVSLEYVHINDISTDIELPEDVPDEYKPYIEQLLATHPEWKFKFLDTGLDWEDLFTEDTECYLGRNVVYKTYPLSYRSTQSGAYNWRSDAWYNPNNEAGWYQANRQTIAYYMDPRNFLNETNIFMFEALSYDEKTQTVDGVKKILTNSFMDNIKIQSSTGESILYAQAYINAGQIADVSPYHLASRTVQEVGFDGSGSTSGTYKAKDGTDYSGFYNFYNIGAIASSDPVANGLKYATGKTSNDAQKERYLLPWNSQYKAIVGGAKWIGNGYINNKQDTLYFQKFNVVNKVWYHQYMANVMAPASESTTIKKTYYNLGILDNSFTFLIPYYRNMPAEACKLPASSNSSPNNWLTSLKIDNYDIKFDAGKTSGYELEVSGAVSSVNISATTVNSKAKVEGVGKVALKESNNEINIVVTAENGDKRTYTINIIRNIENKIPLKSISLDKTDISMFNGDSTTLKVSFNPSTTTDDTTIKWSSSNTKVASISSAGKITAVGEGTATITAKVGNFTAICKVTVSNKIVKG
ncbi:MAG: Ig-like domain-containing protein, partial [Clostridia bacterium]|nr:Ig-like domain-containing protein [Clostridia bacterium]